jgi:hypothetical protein
MVVFGRDTSRQIARQAKQHGLIDSDDEILGHESGVCAGYRDAIPTYAPEPTTLGFTQHRLVLISSRRVAAAELVNLHEIALKSDARGQYLTVTAVRDRDAGFSTWTFRSPAAAHFASALQEAAASSRADRPELARTFEDWGNELQRRNFASIEIADALNTEESDPFIGAEELPVRLRTLADEPKHAALEPLFEVDASLLSLRDGRFILAIDLHGEGSPVAMFRNEDVTYLAFPGPSSTPREGGTWEIGFRSANGERRVIFNGPGLSLLGADVDSADRWHQVSGLLSDESVARTGLSWLNPAVIEKSEVRAMSAPVVQTKNAGSRPRRKRR